MEEFKKELEKHLLEKIVPFWKNQRDLVNGGYFGKTNTDLAIIETHEKGAIQMARFLFSFSRLENHYHTGEYLEYADHAYNFLRNFHDRWRGGYYFMSDYKGNVTDKRKHLYAQCFVLYGLLEYFKANKSLKVLGEISDLVDLIEEKYYSAEKKMYLEEMDENFNELPNILIGSDKKNTPYTMNTTIHLLEAYTVLAECIPSKKNRERVEKLIDLLYRKYYNPVTESLRLFFDESMKAFDKTISYGHDIEATWLIDRAIDICHIRNMDYNQMTLNIADKVFNVARFNGSVVNELKENGELDSEIIWWVQAEAMVGFYNYYSKTRDVKYLEAVKEAFEGIKKLLVSDAQDGCWHWSATLDGEKNHYRGFAEPWKTPYHNVRALLEVIERMEDDQNL